jgi:hypothetical protein
MSWLGLSQANVSESRLPEVQFQFTSTEFTNLLVNKKVHTKENGDVWRIVTETGESGNLKLSGKPSDESSYWSVYGFVIKS